MFQEGNRPSYSSISFILILLLVLVAFGLRLLYVTRISLYIDEFTSIWAAKLILEKGLPLTPAGVIYHRGIFFSYVIALSAYLFGFTEEAGRMSSVFIAVITVPCLYLVGRRMFSDRSGLLAAAFLTFAPQAVIWGARARMYALLQLLSLLAAYFLYVGVVESKRDTYLYLFAICFCGAIFTQEQAVLLYPALLLAVIALGRWRWFFQPNGILVNALCCMAIMSRYLLDRVGRPTQFELVQAAGLSSGFVEGLMASFSAYLSFFLHPDQVLLTVLLGAGLIYALREITARGRVLEAARNRWLESLAFLSLVFALIALEMFIAGGARWSDPRYFFMILPLFILGASGSLDRILALMWERLPAAGSDNSYSGMVRIPSWPVLCSLVGMIAVVYLPLVNSIMSQQIEGHDRAMEYVRGHWQEGDVIITASPPLCAVYLDHCDYFAMQKGYEGYVIDREGQTVDVWTGTPLLKSSDQLKEVLQENDRVWFVVDGWRLATRYEIDFLQVVAEQMGTVQEVQGVKILLSQGYVPPRTPDVQRSVEVNLEGRVALVGYDLETDLAHPQQELCITLYWQPLTTLNQGYTVFVHLVSRDASTVGQDDAVPMAGLYPTVYWQEGETVPDRHCFVPHGDLPEDRYLLEVGMYVPETAERLEVVDGEGNPIADRIAVDYLWVGTPEEAIAPPVRAVGANLADQILLMGYGVDDGSSASDEAMLTVQPGGVIPLSLQWQSLASMERDLTVFVHLVDKEGHIWGQADGQPDHGFYPTSFWDPGEVILDGYDTLVDASVPAGQYKLVAGMYLFSTGERLPVLGEDGQVLGDEVLLTMVQVEEH